MERNMFYDTKFDSLFSKMHNETKTLNMYIDQTKAYQEELKK